MIILKVAGLAFWTFYAYSMGQYADLNSFGKFAASSFFLAAPLLYMIPTFEAWQRKHKSLASIALVNILLGWSIVGWVVAMVWAIKEAVTSSVDDVSEKNLTSAVKPTRTCPYCAEEILANAKICKHCRSNVEEFDCPHCHSKVINKPELAGTQATCPKCDGQYTYA